MNFIFLMDPLETVNMELDTSFILMLESHRRGHRVFFLPDGGIVFKEGQFTFHVEEILPQRAAGRPFLRQGKRILKAEDADAIFVRSDPPFDGQYLLNSWLLDLLPKNIFMMNSPSGIRTVNEKLWALQFKDCVPPTLVTRRKQEMLEFFHRHKEIVAKPTDGHGGQKIFHIKKSDTNANVIFEVLSENESKEIILQKFIPESKIGDKRILLLDGDILGAVLRVHPPGEHRNNIFAGGEPLPAPITARDREIVKKLKPKLRALGLYFVGIDILGKYLTEVNVTSPTCLQEMNRLYNISLEKKVINFVEKKG